MPTFHWQGHNAYGEADHGDIVANNLLLAKLKLQQKGFIISHIKEQSFWRNANKKWSRSILIDFYQHLANLLNAGLSITEALQTLNQYHRNIASLAKQILNKISQGFSLSDSFYQAGITQAIDQTLIKAAEQSGQLTTFLVQISHYHHAQQQTQREIWQALSYPIFISIFSCLMLLGMLTWIMPQFATLFSQMNCQLPLLTRTIMNIANLLFPISIIIFVIPLTLFLFKKTSFYRQHFVDIFWHMPVVGKLWQWQEWQRFCITLALLLEAGLPIAQALQTTANTFNYQKSQQAINKVIQQITLGESLAKAFQENAFLKKRSLIPKKLLHLIAIGETTGRLSPLLISFSEELQQHFKRRLQILIRLLEPSILIILGLSLAIVMIALYLPIFQMGQGI